MKFQKKVLDNGLTVLFEKRDVPVTTVMLAVKYGSEFESKSEKGMAHFIEHLCFKGTDKRSVQEIASEVESVGGELNAFTHEEVTAYHVKLPSNHLKLAMDVLFDVFFYPTFPEAEIEKEAGVICEEIKMYQDNPRLHVLDNIKNCLYEAPFGDFIAGTQENVRGMTRKQLLGKHNEVYRTGNSILCVVGNNDFDEVISLVESMDIREGSVETNFSEIFLKNEKKEERRKDIQQTNLAMGFHFPRGNEELKYAAEVFSSILGDGMSSRLFSEVREKRGLVYGIKTDLDMGRNYGYFIIWAGTDPQKEKEVFDICLKEIKKMNELTEDELKMAKVQIIGNRHVDSEDSSDVAVGLILEEISGDALEYYDFEEKINSVTLNDIKNLASITEYSSFLLGP